MPVHPAFLPPRQFRGLFGRRRLAAAAAAAGFGLAAPGLAVPAHAARAADAGATRAAGQDTVLRAALGALPAPERAEVQRAVDGARAAGLPVAPLERKVVEGVAKDAAPARIVAVVRAVADGLAVARSALGAGAGEAELTAAGAAVQAGAGPDQLRRLRAGVPRGRAATQAFVVLTDLTRRGVPAADGAAALAQLARAGAGDDALARLRADVAADVASGAVPRAAVTRRTDALLRGAAPPRSPVASPTPSPFDP